MKIMASTTASSIQSMAASPSRAIIRAARLQTQ
jgi:hypothetical protein